MVGRSWALAIAFLHVMGQQYIFWWATCIFGKMNFRSQICIAVILMIVAAPLTIMDFVPPALGGTILRAFLISVLLHPMCMAVLFVCPTSISSALKRIVHLYLMWSLGLFHSVLSALLLVGLSFGKTLLARSSGRGLRDQSWRRSQRGLSDRQTAAVMMLAAGSSSGIWMGSVTSPQLMVGLD